MIEIPPGRLQRETLDALIEAFILREGTDYGSVEVSLGDKLSQVRRQIERGEVFITYDPATENCNLMTREEFRRAAAESCGD